MSVATHIVARTRFGFDRVVEPESARWLWTRLRRAMPDALAATLMPNHVHAGVLGDGARELEAFRRMLQHHGRQFGARWELVKTPATTSLIAERMVRYISLNALRARLVDDPWLWPWTTVRELAGATVDPWTRDAVRAAVPGSLDSILRRLTSDGSCRPPLPDLDPPLPVVVTWEAATTSVAAAMRVSPGEVLARGRARRLLIQTVTACGTTNAAALARRVGVSRQTVHNALRSPDPRAVSAVLRCLGDPRLRVLDVGRRVR